MDSSPLPPQGAVAWRYPAGAEGGADATAAIAVRGPAACVEGAILVPVAAGPRRGLACLEHDAPAPAGTEGGPRERWFFETPLGVTASPAADRQVVLVADGVRGDAGRSLRCLDLATGKERWRAAVATDAGGAFLLGPGCVFIESDAGTLACLDLGGTILWRRALGPMSGSAAWEGAIAVAAIAAPPALVALDRPTGAVLWRVALDSPPATGPAVRDSVVYLGTAAGIEARSLIDGAVVWRAATGGAAGALALGRDSLVYVNTAGELVRIDPKTGRPCARLPGALAVVPPVLVQNGVLFASAAGLMLWDGSAAEAATWLDTSALGAISSPVVTAKGRAYFATDRGGFLAAAARGGSQSEPPALSPGG
jgi:outer membrane protein assembly factor BamB